MYKSKLFQLIKHLDEREFVQFGEFVRSPLHNKNRKIITIFDIIQECYPNLQHASLEKEKVYSKIFDGPHQDNKMRAMIAIVTGLLEDFMVYNRLQDNPLLKQQLLGAYVSRKNMDKQYHEQLDKLYTYQQLHPYRDVKYYFEQHQLEEDNYNFMVKKKDKSIGPSLQKLVNNLDTYYVAKRLKYSCEVQNRKNILGEKYEDEVQHIIIDLANGGHFAEVPVINIYRLILLMLENEENTTYYKDLKVLLEAHSTLFPAHENKVMYGYAMNYCIKKINSGRPEFLYELFDLYKLLLQYDLLYEGQYMSEWDYKNIVTVGLRLEELDWTEQFITTCKTKLPLDRRENAYIYNLANLNYFKKDFKNTLRLLQQVEFTDESYLLSSRSLLMKSYFELDEYDALVSQAESFKLFLNRNKNISDYQRSIYKNLIRYIKKLAMYKYTVQAVPEKVSSTILSSPNIADSTWLKKKLEELAAIKPRRAKA